MLQGKGGDQGFVVGRNWLFMPSYALDVSRDRALGHLSIFRFFGQGSPVSNTAGQSGHDGGESAFRFGPEHHVERIRLPSRRSRSILVWAWRRGKVTLLQ